MDTFDAIYKRRAVKHYDPSHLMPAADLEKIVDAAMQSPTAFNIQHWRIVHVQDKALRQQIREVAWNQAQVTDASALLILCADSNAWTKNPARYWAQAPKEVQDFLVPAIEGYYKGQDQVQRDETMRSCGILGQTIMLAAKALGYDSCPMDGFDYEAVGKLIQLPKDHVISFMIAIGKGTKEAWPKPGQLPRSEVLIKDRFKA
jgi:nitroreductase